MLLKALPYSGGAILMMLRSEYLRFSSLAISTSETWAQVPEGAPIALALAMSL
ncbi:Uncharacterised protein [Bordetella pertussis]|nr:Uncharacterised protein [Bordetella pertussis]